ncbi:helix-turn-helix transcriptional regulator [Vagococcus sp. BWB3-3]|uniref:Helix-turn-helix transcriptional regulator n=1 Tax=Vagococcus allomyrinae TaxID=2794353 RepID=A0A940SXN1_9ENTE|nr:helix-turn-helix transcriptional regulator [Vagococcus allomyrinae]MBP1044294.1 helix-turn-helix transcriptional regulator [Vagococcus allomyrinae]
MEKFLGIKIRSLRTSMGISQSKLAQGLISNSYLSNIEKGRKIPSFEILHELASRLDTTDTIFYEDKNLELKTEQLLVFEKCFDYIKRGNIDDYHKTLDLVNYYKLVNLEFCFIYDALVTIADYRLFEQEGGHREDEINILLEEIDTLEVSELLSELLLYLQIVRSVFNEDFPKAGMWYHEYGSLLLKKEAIDDYIVAEMNSLVNYLNCNKLDSAYEIANNLEYFIMENEEKLGKAKYSLYALSYYRGFIYKNLNLHFQSLKAFAKMDDSMIRRDEQGHYHFILSLIERGNIYESIDSTLAASYYEDAYIEFCKYSQNEESWYWYGEPLSRLFLYYCKVKDFEKSEFLLKKSEKVNLSQYDDQAYLLYGKSLYEEYLGNRQKQVDYLEQALILQKLSKTKLLIRTICLKLSNVHYNSSQYKKAHYYLVYCVENASL